MQVSNHHEPREGGAKPSKKKKLKMEGRSKKRQC